MEKEEPSLLAEWMNCLEFQGEYLPLRQISRSEAKKMFENPFEMTAFIIEKKRRKENRFYSSLLRAPPFWETIRNGLCFSSKWERQRLLHRSCQDYGGLLVSLERHMRIQASTNAGNVTSQKVLEKVGFQKEGTIRKSFFLKGELRDAYLYSILREEWKEPKTLTKTAWSRASNYSLFFYIIIVCGIECLCRNLWRD